MRQVWFQVKQRKRAERKMGLKSPRLHCSSQERSTRLPGSHQATVACWRNSVSARNALALTPLPHSVMAWGEWGLGSNSGMDLKMQLLRCPLQLTIRKANSHGHQNSHQKKGKQMYGLFVIVLCVLSIYLSLKWNNFYF